MYSETNIGRMQNLHISSLCTCNEKSKHTGTAKMTISLSVNLRMLGGETYLICSFVVVTYLNFGMVSYAPVHGKHACDLDNM